jgi:hypothetical protein
MRSWLRLIGIVLLLAHPLQGWAAASRIACAHPMPPPHSADASHHAMPHDHGHRAEGSNGGAKHAGSVFAGVGDAASPSSSADGVPGTCAYCAVCCVGAALVDWAGQLVAPRPAQVEYPSHAAAACPQPFDGPERPPRTF